MSEFSPQTQAAWDAAYNTPEDCPYEHDLAAALEAVADQVVPFEKAPELVPAYGRNSFVPRLDFERLAQRQHTRTQLLAIAAELRGDTTSNTH
jgi:hypothetical protein